MSGSGSATPLIPTSMSATTSRPRIFRVRYRSALGRRRIADGFVKVPYASMFALVDTLTRAVETNQVLWFRVDVATAQQIARVRDQLVRWTEFLSTTTQITEVDFTS